MLVSNFYAMSQPRFGEIIVTKAFHDFKNQSSELQIQLTGDADKKLSPKQLRDHALIGDDFTLSCKNGESIMNAVVGDKTIPVFYGSVKPLLEKMYFCNAPTKAPNLVKRDFPNVTLNSKNAKLKMFLAALVHMNTWVSQTK